MNDVAVRVFLYRECSDSRYIKLLFDLRNAGILGKIPYVIAHQTDFLPIQYPVNYPEQECAFDETSNSIADVHSLIEFEVIVMKKIKPVVLLFLGVTILSVSINGTQASEPDPIDALKACARMENTKKRAACYEALGEQVLGEEIAASATETAVPAAEKPAAAEVESPAVDDNRYFFILDSGEIWKQSGGRTHRFKDCSFDVTIRKDVFGYKMTIDGDDKTVRVRRHK